MMAVRILRPSLDDLDATTVLRGVLDRDCLEALRVDLYQREILPARNRRPIERALENEQRLPDIDLGMRGERWQMEDNQAVLLLDPVYIIDGLQRVTTCREHLRRFPDANVNLGAVVHFNSNLPWERTRFQELNGGRTRVSFSILLRNMKEGGCPALAMLYGLSGAERDFPLYHRVAWQQMRETKHLVGGSAVARAAIHLHAHLVPPHHLSTPAAIVQLLNRLSPGRIGLGLFRENIRSFWGLIDFAFGIPPAAVAGRGQVQFRQTFLEMLARVFSMHTDFWQGERLVVPYELKTKLRRLPLGDSTVLQLASGSGKARDAFYHVLVDHVNSGKRTKHLTPREPVELEPELVPAGSDAPPVRLPLAAKGASA